MSSTLDSHSEGTIGSASSHSQQESSKSGSGVAERDEDFTKDNHASPIDLECNIQAERITKILDELVYKSTLVVCLPTLVRQYRTLESILSRQDMLELVFIYEQYENSAATDSCNAELEDIDSLTFRLKSRQNPELGHLLYIMTGYPALRPVVSAMVEEMKKHPEQPVAGLEYLQALERFRELMVARMATSAAEELAAKFEVRKLEKSNEELLAKIDEYQTAMRTEQHSFEENMRVKSELIARLQQEVAVLQMEAAGKLKKKILDSDRQMVLATRAHLAKYDMLREEEAEVREGYEALLRSHLAEEKSQRARRCKVETQLLSWLQKYDLEMSEKQLELDDYTLKYDEELERTVELEKQLALQDKEYIPLMEERDKEYHEELTRKMQAFKLEHAARVIQVAWRDVLKNRAEKKKLKKLIKKMQEQQAREAAAAEAAARAAEKAAAREAKQAAKEAKEAAKAAKAEAAAKKAAEAAEQQKAAKK